MKRKKKEPPFDPKTFLSKVNGGQTKTKYRKGEFVYRQGDPADSVFYVQAGKVKKTLLSEQGREAVVADFLKPAISLANDVWPDSRAVLQQRPP